MESERVQNKRKIYSLLFIKECIDVKVKITETVLRDANQSLIATRLPFEKFEPILETMDKAGFYSVEWYQTADKTEEVRSIYR